MKDGPPLPLPLPHPPLLSFPQQHVAQINKIHVHVQLKLSADPQKNAFLQVCPGGESGLSPSFWFQDLTSKYVQQKRLT